LVSWGRNKWVGENWGLFLQQEFAPWGALWVNTLLFM
jgi:hypothetical protein